MKSRPCYCTSLQNSFPHTSGWNCLEDKSKDMSMRLSILHRDQKALAVYLGHSLTCTGHRATLIIRLETPIAHRQTVRAVTAIEFPPSKNQSSLFPSYSPEVRSILTCSHSPIPNIYTSNKSSDKPSHSSPFPKATRKQHSSTIPFQYSKNIQYSSTNSS